MIKQETRHGLVFWVLASLALIALYLASGFYYLRSNQYAIIVVNGKVNHVVKGMRMGLTLPYPFSVIRIVDGSPSALLPLVAANSAQGNYVAFVTKDDRQITVSARFAYQVVNAGAFYKSGFYASDASAIALKLKIQEALRSFIARHAYGDIIHSNLTIVAEAIKQSSNVELQASGIYIVHLDIEKIDSQAQSQEEQRLTPQAPAQQQAQNNEPASNTYNDTTARWLDRRVNRARADTWY